MIDNDLKKELMEKDNFEWSQRRYEYDKNMSTLYGHAKKHLVNEYKRFSKLMNYDINNINDETVENYKKISIDNINNNKYVNNRVYFNLNNRSINVVGDNNLETCLKPSIIKNNELVIVSCFFRNYIYDFYNSMNTYSKSDLGLVYKYFIDSNSISDTKSIDFEKIKSEYIKSLKENKSNEITKMIDKYYSNDRNIVKDKLEKEINILLNKTINIINNLTEYGKDSGYVFDEIEIVDYNTINDVKYLMQIFEKNEEDIINEIDHEEKRKELILQLELNDIYDIINDLCVIYIYSKIFDDYEILFKYCKLMNYISQLSSVDNNLEEIIHVNEALIKYNGKVNGNWYRRQGIILNYKEPEKLLN